MRAIADLGAPALRARGFIASGDPGALGVVVDQVFVDEALFFVAEHLGDRAELGAGGHGWPLVTAPSGVRGGTNVSPSQLPALLAAASGGRAYIDWLLNVGWFGFLKVSGQWPLAAFRPKQ